MIKKLQRRFIRISLVALTVAMVLVTLTVNAANWFSVRTELTETLLFLADNSGMTGREAMKGRLTGKSRHARNLISESSWFTVFLDESGSVKAMDLSNSADMDEAAAESLAQQAPAPEQEPVFVQDHLCLARDTAHGRRMVLFLNCETRLASVRALALFSLLACLGGIFLAWLFVTLASRRAIEPTIRNMEQQKRFITDASHELKTPLTVISTNMDLLQMEQGDNPWVISTQKQAGQMRKLVDELVYLSRMEEENAPLSMEDVPLLPLITETAEPFMTMAEYQGKTMETEELEEVNVRGDRASLQRLLSTLLDNAVKYAAPEGTIRVKARPEGRWIVVTVANEVERELTEEQCRQLFNRFYRTDMSRSKEKQTGFGIGLSIAAAIAEKHGGDITARMEGRFLVMTCRLPKGGHTA